MKTSEIASIVGAGRCQVASPDEEVRHLLTDSRRLTEVRGTVFFAITTRRNRGFRYVDELFARGVRSFVVPEGSHWFPPEANVWEVSDVVGALQQLAARHRQDYRIPVVGITGSNGKTIVKDWLMQLLSPERKVVASPKSYNSQIGVPLSVWQMGSEHEMAIFEAGISQPGEMDALQRVIRPTIGILTNIGQAHDEYFQSHGQKLAEKSRLFAGCETVVCQSEYAPAIRQMLPHLRLFVWGQAPECDLELLRVEERSGQSRFSLRAQGRDFQVSIPFTDRASRENAMHCIATMLLLGYPAEVIAERCGHLSPVEMRLEMKEGIGNCLLLNDSYSLDFASLEIAVDHLVRQPYYRRTIIMSDILQAGIGEDELYRQVAGLLRQKGVQKIIGIGPALMRWQGHFEDFEGAFYPTTEAFLDYHDTGSFHNEAILLKGARVFGFEKIARLLQRKSHETVMEVNLDALVHNLNFYRSRLAPRTKLMAMVKASSYGAGMVEVSAALQYNHVDYLTVAYIDEGVELRRNGITLPIMVMNPEEAGFDDIVRYRLEPDIYSFRILDAFVRHLRTNVRPEGLPFPIHVEFDTGMHRLGFAGDDAGRLLGHLKTVSDVVEVKSVFSHLACSEDSAMDGFTQRQIEHLRQWSAPFPGIKHILNSSGISRFPEAQMDMVRLGIGLYGVAPEAEVQARLRQVSRLVTRISQIKAIPEGDTVGYNCRWRAARPSRIAILPIGYADGWHRHLDGGNGRVAIGGHEAPIIGSICMDMCFVDVTDVPCAEGDRVVLFGEGDLLQRNAAAAGTIPYELLTSVAPRVRRVYYHEE